MLQKKRQKRAKIMKRGEKKMQKSEREKLFEILTTETFARFDK